MVLRRAVKADAAAAEEEEEEDDEEDEEEDDDDEPTGTPAELRRRRRRLTMDLVAERLPEWLAAGLSGGKPGDAQSDLRAYATTRLAVSVAQGFGAATTVEHDDEAGPGRLLRALESGGALASLLVGLGPGAASIPSTFV